MKLKPIFLSTLFISLTKMTLAQKEIRYDLRIPIDNAEIIEQADFITDVQYTPLSSKNLVGRVISMAINASKLYMSNTDEILIFNLEGKFEKKVNIFDQYKSKIVKIKSGAEKNLEIYLKGGNIINIDSKGDVQKNDKLSAKVIDSVRIGTTDWILNKPIKSNKNFLVKKEDNTVTYHYDFPEDKKGNSPILMSDNKGFIANNFDNSYLVYYPFIADILEIRKDNNIVRYNLIFPAKNSFNFAESDFSDPNNYLRFINSNENFINFYSLLLRFDKGIVFSPSLAKNYKDYYSYEFETGKLTNLSKLSFNQKSNKLPIFSVYNAPIIWSDSETCFYSLIYADDIQYNLSNISKKNKIATRILKNRNPTLVKFRFKD